MKRSMTLADMYECLYRVFGPQEWWPGDTRLEIIVGAILTQNTAWTNVERAIVNLKRERLLSSSAVFAAAGVRRLAALIRPAGYYRVKARRLTNLMRFIRLHYNLDLDAMARQKTIVLRDELLAVNGIGPETADAILLYAFDHPIFVVDGYTKRILGRHGVCRADDDYHVVQKIFTDALPADAKLFNEYHALIVRLGKEFCRKTNPRCAACPLHGIVLRPPRRLKIP